jgi:hypothetical protein
MVLIVSQGQQRGHRDRQAAGGVVCRGEAPKVQLASPFPGSGGRPVSLIVPEDLRYLKAQETASLPEDEVRNIGVFNDRKPGLFSEEALDVVPLK